MVIPYEIGMIEHFAHNVPTVKTLGDIVNGFIGTIDVEHGVVAPAGRNTAADGMYVAINTMVGDDAYTDAKIAAGSLVNYHALDKWIGRHLIVSGDNISATYAEIAVGDVLAADEYGKLATLGAGGLRFKVVEKMMWCGEPAVRVEIAVIG